MKKIVLMLAFNVAIFAYSYAATVTWDGGAGTDNWTDVLNWDTDALPTSSDDVDINGAMVSLAGISARVQRVYVQGGGQLTIESDGTLAIDGFAGNDDGLETTSSATIINNGAIQISNITGTGADAIYSRNVFINNGNISINGMGQHGIYMVGGTFTNSTSGTITITNVAQTTSSGDYIYIDDSGGLGTFTNDGGITITMTTGDDGIYVNDGTIFNNNATVSIVPGAGSTADNGMRVDDAGIFNNNIGGTLNIGATPDDQLFLDNTGGVNNAGTINLTNAADVGLYVTDAGVFTNTTDGIVNISGASNYSIQVDANMLTAEIVNNGLISVVGGSNDGLRLQEGGTMTNNMGGTLSISAPAKDGINIQGSGGTLNNAGLIDISLTVNEGMDMIGGTFNNLAGGVYMATDCVDDGLEVNAAVVNNDGDIRISGSGSEDIETFAGFTFNNTANATFAPGASPGEFELKGDFDLGTSTTIFEIGGTTHTTEYDRIENFSGASITITNATMHLDWGAYVPNIGDRFTVIDGSGGVTGTFANVTSSNANIVVTMNYSDATEVEVEVTNLLPVELVRFTAEKSNEGALLAWQTASEVSNEGFEIERSYDNQHWTKIGYVRGNGDSYTAIQYTFLDRTPVIGTNYYRLKQNDFDGHFDYSNIVALDFENEKSEFTVYPNPVEDVLYIDLNQASDILEIQLYDATGKILWTQQGAVRQIPFGAYPSGVYFLKIVNPSNQTIQKIINN